MTKIIYKYPLAITDYQDIYIPKNSKILSVDVQLVDDYYMPCIWALVDPSENTVAQKIRIIGTGQSIQEDKDMQYLGTFLHDGWFFVGHVFLVNKDGG